MCQEFVSCIPCHYKQRIAHKAYVYSAKGYNTQFFFCCVCTFPSSTTQLTAAANVCAGVAFQDAEVLERARARHARAPPGKYRVGCAGQDAGICQDCPANTFAESAGTRLDGFSPCVTCSAGKFLGGCSATAGPGGKYRSFHSMLPS